VVEHRLAKARVASSNLVSRSNLDEGGRITAGAEAKSLMENARIGPSSSLYLCLLNFILSPLSFILSNMAA
jgi:hypothetical protein